MITQTLELRNSQGESLSTRRVRVMVSDPLRMNSYVPIPARGVFYSPAHLKLKTKGFGFVLSIGTNERWKGSYKKKSKDKLDLNIN